MPSFRWILAGAWLLPVAAAQSVATLDELGQIAGPGASTEFASSVRASPTSLWAAAVDAGGVRRLHPIRRNGAVWTVAPALSLPNVLGFDGESELFAVAYEQPGATWPRKLHVEQWVGGAWLSSSVNGPHFNWGSTNFGEIVAVSGDTLAVSEPNANVGPPPNDHARGKVHFLRYQAGQLVSSTWLGGPVKNAHLGRNLDLAGDYALAGFSPALGSFNHLRTFRRVGGVWQVEQMDFELPWGPHLVRLLRMSPDGMAVALAADVDVLAVLAHGPDGWFVEALLPPQLPPSISSSPSSLAFEDGVIALGYDVDDAAGQDAGAVVVWTRNGGWSPISILHASDARAGDRFGASVDFAGGRLYVGAPGDDDGGVDVGAVYEFEVQHPGAQVSCSTTPHAEGCIARIAFDGTPGASSLSDFTLSARDVRRSSRGMLLYGASGVLPASYGGGVRCVAPVRAVTALANSLGQPSLPCSGAFTFDFNAFIRSGADPALIPGATIGAVFAFRDPLAPGGYAATDAVRFVVQP